VWDLESRQRVQRLELPPAAGGYAAQCAAVFSPDNTRLVTMVPNHGRTQGEPLSLSLTGWDLGTGKKLGELQAKNPFLGFWEDNRVYAAAPNNTTMVLATSDGKLWVADYEKGATGETLSALTRHTHRFTCPTFSPDGKVFAVGMPVDRGLEYGVRLYSWPDGKALHTFTGHRGAITALSFSPDGKTLASGSADGTVLLWDMTAVEKK
jgi:WD40 repeat protein